MRRRADSIYKQTQFPSFFLKRSCELSSFVSVDFDKNKT